MHFIIIAKIRILADEKKLYLIEYKWTYQAKSQVPYVQRGIFSMHNMWDYFNSQVGIEWYQYINIKKKYNIPPNIDEALRPYVGNISVNLRKKNRLIQ